MKQEPVASEPDHSAGVVGHRLSMLTSILPYTDPRSLDVLTNPGTWIMLALSTGVLAFYGPQLSHETQVLLLMGYFSIAWAVYFYVFVAKRRSSLWIGVATFAFTRLVGRWFGHLLKITILAPLYHINNSTSDPVRLMGVLGSYGLCEELLKALPLVLLAFVFKRMKTPVDGIFYGAFSGLSFAAWEGYTYLTIESPPGWIVIDSLLRSTLNFFSHAAYTAISGYFIALAVRSRRPVLLCVLGIAMATTIHGVYDFLTGIVRLTMAVIVFLLFAAYANRSHQIAQELEEPNTKRPIELQTTKASEAAAV